MKNQINKTWTKTQLLSDVVTNKNIIVKGSHSYYSDYWDDGFEQSVVRYLLGDELTRDAPTQWEVDKLYIGDYVCIAAEVVILMGGNHNHRVDWFSLYPFMDHIEESYIGKGDTHIGDGCWIGMRAMIMPGVRVGEGAVIAANSVVTKNVEPYSIVGGNPAKHIRYRFSREVIDKLVEFDIYSWPEDKFDSLKPYLCSSDLTALERAIKDYDQD
ncbi:CatB-related O-acetyltransferase [Photobacterium alginatilyticum]|uniref:Chloramphenicol acetyltransferase n=1 Tax=Photobacterium alginatilyticum TaxID=1775171 RepID=A0ABW9YEA8_9GAMM|nr:CatB-related O-acetyltransferase [Photobacterium alginatilyticum]